MDWDNRHGLAARRLAVGTIVGAITLVVSLLLGASWNAAASLGWCSIALVVLVWAWASIGPKDPDETMEHARQEDFSRATADVLLLGAGLTSLIAVGFTLVEAGGAHGMTKTLLIALALATVVLAWATVHTVYTVRYGDLYYSDPMGGIDFNGDDRPDYLDFAYLAITMGMTYQVSDTALKTKKLRRVAVRHALLSYLFGAVIGAVLINTVASLLSG
jgi:uncharacterized membrane protein